MRRLILTAALGLAFSIYALPQEPASKAEPKSESEQGDPWIWWKWVNFLILAGGLGYLISKHAPPYFVQRSHEIQDALLEGARAKQEAEARAAVIEKRLAGLDREMDSLRQTAGAETAA